MNLHYEPLKPIFSFSAQELIPEQKLIAAIITQALIDSEQNIPPYPADKRYHSIWLESVGEIYESRRWLFSSECEYYLNLINFPVDVFYEHINQHYSWAKRYKVRH